MKKLVIFSLTLALLVGAGSAMGAVVTIDNHTTAYDQGGHPYAYSTVIGSPAYFNTPKAEFDTVSGQFTIFTDWNPGKDGYLSVNTAFLFIDNNADGTWDYAVDLDIQSTTKTAQPLWKAPLTIVYSSAPVGYTFGKAYATALTLAPVTATATSGGTADVTWSYTSNTSTGNTVIVDLNGLVTTNPWNFFYATATCANGPFVGSSDGMVPLPPSAILLGTGLLGLVGLGWRRRKTNV